MIKTALIILALFWILAFISTANVYLWVLGFSGALICLLGLTTTVLMWRIVKKLEKLEKKIN
jgi:hypothetical protein